MTSGKTMTFGLLVREGGEELFAGTFPEGEYVLGQSHAADIIIPELHSPEAAALRLERTGFVSRIILRAMAPGIVVGQRELKPGESEAFEDKAAFEVEGFAFLIHQNAADHVIVAPGSLPVLLVAGAVLAGMAGLLMNMGALSPPPPAPALKTAIPEAYSAQERLAAAENGLRLKLVAANLTPPLRVTRDPASVIVTGAVDEDERSRALEIVSAFQERSGAPLELRLTTNPDPAGFVVAVALKPERYIVGRDGKRYGIGEKLPDGGIIGAIEETSVLIERDRLKERVVYTR